MKEQNAWVAVAVVVIVAIVAAYVGSLMGQGTLLAPASSGGTSSAGITVTGKVVFTTEDGEVGEVGLDTNGNNVIDPIVLPANGIASQFGQAQSSGNWLQWLVGSTITFSDCAINNAPTVSRVPRYDCNSKHIGSNLVVDDSTESG